VREYLTRRGVVVAPDAASLVTGLNSLLDKAAARELDLAGPSRMAQRTAEQRAWFDERTKSRPKFQVSAAAPRWNLVKDSADWKKSYKRFPSTIARRSI